MTHLLYRMFDRSDALLYIGITIDLGTRISSHRALQPWWHDVTTIRLEVREIVAVAAAKRSR